MRGGVVEVWLPLPPPSSEHDYARLASLRNTSIYDTSGVSRKLWHVPWNRLRRLARGLVVYISARICVRDDVNCKTLSFLLKRKRIDNKDL